MHVRTWRGGLVVVGELIAEKMGEQGLNQYQLAKKAKVDQGHLSKILSGEYSMPRKPTRDKLAKALGLEDEDFFRAAGILKSGDPQPRLVQLPLEEPDQQFDADAIVAYVESKPGPRFQEQLRAQRDRLSRADYVRFCVGLFRTWSSSADNVFASAEVLNPGR